MDETTTSGEARAPSEARPRRVRRGLKRLRFSVPKMPLGVRDLWKAASEEERQQAHRCAVALLQAWLGKTTREEGAKALGLSPLRFWQLSQQAVAGMVAGCLRQPRARRGRPPTIETEEGAAALRQKVRTLETELSQARTLIEILKQLPGHREAPSDAAPPNPTTTDASGREPPDGRETPRLPPRRQGRRGRAPRQPSNASAVEGQVSARRAGAALGPTAAPEGT
jgi:hypothetical protein